MHLHMLGFPGNQLNNVFQKKEVTNYGISNMEKIKRIIEEKLGLETRDYTLESKFNEDLGCDSLDMIDLALSVENEFNISIPDDALNNIKTVKDLIDYVEEHTK